MAVVVTMKGLDSFVYWTSEKKGGVCALCLGSAVSYATQNPGVKVLKTRVALG